VLEDLLRLLLGRDTKADVAPLDDRGLLVYRFSYGFLQASVMLIQGCSIILEIMLSMSAPVVLCAAE